MGHGAYLKKEKNVEDGFIAPRDKLCPFVLGIHPEPKPAGFESLTGVNGCLAEQGSLTSPIPDDRRPQMSPDAEESELLR